MSVKGQAESFNRLKGSLSNPSTIGGHVSIPNTIKGKSAYELALLNGFEGTEAEWLESLKGKNAFQIAVDIGFKGTETEWLASLVGYTPIKGIDYFDGKSAYQYARDGGFTGTEEDFIKKLNQAYGTGARIGEVTLTANGWNGSDNLYSQVVTIDGVTENSQVDLTPSVEQLAVFYEKDLTFVTENEDGVVTVYAIGQKPQSDYTIQVTITEVA